MKKVNLNSEKDIKEWVDQLVDAIEVVDHLFGGASMTDVGIGTCGTHWCKSSGVHIFVGLSKIFEALKLEGETLDRRVNTCGNLELSFTYRGVRFFELVGEINPDGSFHFSNREDGQLYEEVGD